MPGPGHGHEQEPAPGTVPAKASEMANEITGEDRRSRETPPDTEREQDDETDNHSKFGTHERGK